MRALLSALLVVAVGGATVDKVRPRFVDGVCVRARMRGEVRQRLQDGWWVATAPRIFRVGTPAGPTPHHLQPKLTLANGLATATPAAPISLHDPGQCFPWSLHASIAGADFAYPIFDERGVPSKVDARRGDLATLRCDSVICPVPATPNCFETDGVCGEDEWCQLIDHVKFGPDAASAHGQSPNMAMRSCTFFRQHASEYSWIWNTICDSHAHWGPWTATRGRCAKYRQDQQSCTATLDPSFPLGPSYHASPANGAPPARELVCAPGLVCTGDMPPLPHTCVKRRPRDVCYAGSWWDSSWCPRVSAAVSGGGGGLSLPDLLAAAAGVLASAPVEAYDGGAADPKFWSAAAANDGRARATAWLEALWPDRYRADTAFPLELPRPRGAPQSAEWNETTAPIVTLGRQINRVWAAIHACVHNAPPTLRPAQVEASRAAAVWLRQRVSCCNCRGFFSALLNEVGLPPTSAARYDHARWWWRTHNMVSEHAASTRGGHPWAYPHQTDAEFAATHGDLSTRLRCQNPWFLEWEDAVAMWTLPEEGGEGRDEL